MIHLNMHILNLINASCFAALIPRNKVQVTKTGSRIPTLCHGILSILGLLMAGERCPS